MILAASGLLCTATAQIPVFTDSFDNGSVSDSDAITAFWTLDTPTHTTIEEVGEALVMTAGGPESPNGGLTCRIRSIIPGQDFNFFRQKLVFSSDLSFSGTATDSQSLVRFALTSLGGIHWAKDAFSIRLQANHRVTVSVKQNRSSAMPENVTTLHNSVNVGSEITGFDLTLDSLNYTLVVRHAGGTGSTVLNGSHGLVAAQWGKEGDGNSCFTFEASRSTGSTGEGQESVFTADRLSVMRLTPSSDVFEDTFNNGNPLDSDLEPAVWSAVLPGTSTALENTGRLELNAHAAEASALTATLSTPAESRFNFFDQTLKFSAQVTATGDTETLSWIHRGRLALASVPGTALNAPDALQFGYFGDNGIVLSYKLDRPNARPDMRASSVMLVADPEANKLGTSESGVIEGFELTLNSTRFQIVVDGALGLSSRVRISGTHGIDRAQWGDNGDSSLMLETMRVDAAPAGSTVSSSWDNLRVQSDDSRLLAEPFWDFEASFSNGSQILSGDFRIWLPSTEPIIRGVIFIGPGSGGHTRSRVHDLPAQELARSMGFALLGYPSSANMNFGFTSWPDANLELVKSAVQSVLDAAAAACGRPEIRNAPLCMTGSSLGGFDSASLAKVWPERTVAFVSHRGNEWYFFTPVLSPATKKVPGLMVAGSNDDNGLTAPLNMYEGFMKWKNQGAQVAFAIDWGAGHQIHGNQGWEATMTWFSEVSSLRYPRPMVPSLDPEAGPPSLLDLDFESGWLGETTPFSAVGTPGPAMPFVNISPIQSYSGTHTNASWLPNEACARMYRALTSHDRVERSATQVPRQGALRIVSPSQYADPVTAGSPVTIELNPREFGITHPITDVQFHNGETWLGTVTEGPDWSLTFTPEEPGLFTLTLTATDTQGNQRAAFRTLHVIPEIFPPVSQDSRRVFTAGGSTSGTLSGTDPEGGPVTFAVHQAPENGLLTLNPETGAYTYRPAHGYTGEDSFLFVPVGSRTTGPSATVSFSVNAPPGPGGDQLPADWKAEHGVTDPEADNDGDGFTNDQEYLALTDPNDSADFPFIHPVSGQAAGAPFTLSWPARGGVRYRVQYSDDLTSDWQEIPRPAAKEIQPGSYGEQGTLVFVDDVTATEPPENDRRFYRVRVIQNK